MLPPKFFSQKSGYFVNLEEKKMCPPQKDLFLPPQKKN